MPMPTINGIRRSFTVFGGLILGAVLLLAIPFIQRHMIYLNSIKWPANAKFDVPELYGMPPNKTLNLNFRTVDNETIGAWFILSDPFYRNNVLANSSFTSLHASPPSKKSPDVDSQSYISVALKTHPTILFLHGNAATRAVRFRVQQYQAFSSRLECNVLAIDYRGFAESTGTPSESGLTLDVHAAWDWLIENGAKAENVLIIGHSLGTGVGAAFAESLEKKDGNAKYRGLVLMSPFSSIEQLLQTYHILGLFPLFKPFSVFPFAMNLINRALIHKFNTLITVPNIKGDVLILHAENDWEIPLSHSETLFDAFMDSLLPSVNHPPFGTILKPDEYDAFQAELQARKDARKELVKTVSVDNFGVIEAFGDGILGRRVTFVKTLLGSHNKVCLHEGAQDIIGQTFDIFKLR